MEGCILWTGAVQSSGYGSVTNGRGGTMLVHRREWENVNGAIPEGMTIDHLCRTKLCMNVEHMEVVTRGENSRRAVVKSHCLKGHPLSGDNLSVSVNSVDGYERRVCKACRRGYAQERYNRLVRVERAVES